MSNPSWSKNWIEISWQSLNLRLEMTEYEIFEISDLPTIFKTLSNEK